MKKSFVVVTWIISLLMFSPSSSISASAYEISTKSISCLPYAASIGYTSTDKSLVVLIVVGILILSQVLMWFLIGKSAWDDLTKQIHHSTDIR